MTEPRDVACNLFCRETNRTFTKSGAQSAERAGKPLVVFLHGWPDDLHVWDKWVPALTGE